MTRPGASTIQGPSDSVRAETVPPTLSVVVPNRNHAEYIGAALRAHLCQTHPPLEILVVDDASTDDSRAVVERIAREEPTVRLLSLACRVGPVAAGKRGLREAKGEYVCLSAADDLVRPEFAERSLAVLAQHPAAAFCFSDPAELLNDGSVREFPLYLTPHPAYFPPDAVEGLLRRNFFTFPAHTLVFRREALLAVGGFREDLDWQAEWLANHALAFRHGVCYVPAVLADYRVRPDSYSALRVREGGLQRALLYRALDHLGTEEFRDVAPRFRRSALATEMRLRVLFWLLASPRHRGYLTPRLAGRLLARELWSAVRPFAPPGLRRALRRMSSHPLRETLTHERTTTSPAGNPR